MTGSETMTLKRSADEALDTAEAGAMGAPVKPLLGFPVKGQEHSLATMMSGRHSGLKSLHMKFAEDMKHVRKVSFGVPEERPEQAEPPMKRRRFQRRNSKTAAMLFTSMSSIIANTDFDLSDSEDDKKHEPADSGLEIAEELVRQLKLRRQSLSSIS